MADTKVNSAGEQQPVDDRSRYAKMSARELGKELAQEITEEAVSGAKDASKVVSDYERRFGDIKQSGAIGGAQSGALNPDNPKDRDRANRHAKITYERIRRTNGDVGKIAKVTRHTEAEIERVKQHMFFNEYDLEDGRHPFDPDFDQAQSWDRLQSGNPFPHDLIMIEHELIESELMAGGMGYNEAHNIANKTANYEQAVKEYKNATAKKKGN